MLGKKLVQKRIPGVAMILLTLGVVVSFSGCIVGPPTELYYDDGTPEMVGACVYGMWDAVKFTPPPASWPMKYAVTEARVYFRVDAVESVKLHVMSDLYPVPGIDIITPITLRPTTTGWHTIDLTAYGITVSGDFYVAVEYPSGTGASDVKLGLDSTSVDLRSYSGGGGGWEFWEVNPNYDYMIRATVALSLFDP